MSNDYFTTTGNVQWKLATEPLLTVEAALQQLGWGKKIIQLPAGFFLNYTHSPFNFDLPNAPVSKDIVRELLEHKFIELDGDALTEIEFEIQRALGLTTAMAQYIITLEGTLQIFKKQFKDAPPAPMVKKWTSTNIDPNDAMWVSQKHYTAIIPTPKEYKGIIWGISSLA